LGNDAMSGEDHGTERDNDMGISQSPSQMIAKLLVKVIAGLWIIGPVGTIAFNLYFQQTQKALSFKLSTFEEMDYADSFNAATTYETYSRGISVDIPESIFSSPNMLKFSDTFPDSRLGYSSYVSSNVDYADFGNVSFRTTQYLPSLNQSSSGIVLGSNTSTESSVEEPEIVSSSTAGEISIVSTPITYIVDRQALLMDLSEAQIRYQIWALSHRRSALSWQMASGISIFFVVLLIVLFGLYLSYEQFRRGGISTTKVAVGKGSVEISSSFIGLFILIVSLGFFYSYLAYVFPIRELGSPTTTTNSPSN
jgi:hypothetical protein